MHIYKYINIVSDYHLAPLSLQNTLRLLLQKRVFKQVRIFFRQKYDNWSSLKSKQIMKHNIMYIFQLKRNAVYVSAMLSVNITVIIVNIARFCFWLCKCVYHRNSILSYTERLTKAGKGDVSVGDRFHVWLVFYALNAKVYLFSFLNHYIYER